MNMTHYMELLAVNQPWNLLIFMAIPVILVETIAITEFFVLLSRNLQGWLRAINRIAGITAGGYFLAVFAYLLVTAVIPITLAGEWRTAIDAIAVGSYLLGVVPLGGIALLDSGLIYRQRPAELQLKIHASFVAAFLVVAHIAMIFGMLDPGILNAGLHLAVL